MSTLIEAIAQHGYATPRQIVADGNLHRFATDPNKRHSKDGWYVAYDDSKGKAGCFGSWRDGNSITWSNGTGRQLTDEEKRDIEAKRKAGLEQARKDREEASGRAKRLYAQASETGQSGYLTKKGIQCPAGVRFIDKMEAAAFGYASTKTISGLIVPVYGPNGDISTLQIIEDDGNKLFLKNGATGGGWFGIGEDFTTAHCVVIAEGLATAQSIYESSGLSVLSAFNAGNLPKVAAMVRSKNATASIILAVDGDQAGRDHSEKAARLVNGRTIEAPEGMDWNDVHAAEGMEAVRKAFITEEISTLWKSDLIIKTKSNGDETIPCRAHNLILILRNDPQYKGRIRLNELTNQLNIDGKDADDAAVVRIKASLEKNYIQEKVPTSDVSDAMGVIGAENAFHPVREYLNSLKWDRFNRIKTALTDYFGVAPSPYAEAVARSFFVSAVARIFKPGCQVDTMVVFEGAQGGYKSTALQTLFSSEFHSEVIANIQDKDFYQNLRGKWCMEFGELTPFRKADASHLKQIITARYDNYRASYARFNRDYPRQNIFAGTTNENNYLIDPTGARRFLPVVCGSIDIAALKTDRNLLWAEAVHLFNSGADWWNIPNAEQEQEDRYQADSWEEVISQWLVGKNTVSINDILVGALEMPIGRHTKADQTRVGAIMTRFKWKKNRDTVGGQRIWRYHRE